MVQAARTLHASRHLLLTSLAAYDRTGYWSLSGATTCAGWAATELDISVGTAREWLRIGHTLEQLPEVAQAFADRTLSYTKIRSLTRIAIDHPDDQAALIDLAAPLAAGDLARALVRWCHRHEEPEQRDRRQDAAIAMSVRQEADGSAVMTLRLPAVEMERIRVAVDARIMRGHPPARRRTRAPEVGSETPVEPDHTRRPSLSRQRALALLDVCTNGATGTGATVQTEVILHVRGDGCTMHDGSPISDNAVASLLDESFIRVLVHDADRRPVNASGRQRHPTDRQKRVVAEREPRCVDCGSTELLEYDHEPEFASSRHTVIDELTRRCARCHRLRHAA